MKYKTLIDRLDVKEIAAEHKELEEKAEFERLKKSEKELKRRLTQYEPQDKIITESPKDGLLKRFFNSGWLAVPVAAILTLAVSYKIPSCASWAYKKARNSMLESEQQQIYLIEGSKREDLNDVPEEKRDELSLHRELVETYRKQENLEMMISEQNKIVTLLPDDIFERTVLAKIYIENSMPINAREQYKAILEINPDNKDALIGIKNALGLMAGTSDIAGLELDDFERAILAERYIGMSEYGMAIEQYNALLRNDLHNKKAIGGIVSAYIKEAQRCRIQTKDYECAVDNAKEALKIKPEDETAELELATSYLERGMHTKKTDIKSLDAALADYQSAVDLVGMNNDLRELLVDAHANKAEIYKRKRWRKSAGNEYKAAYELDHNQKWMDEYNKLRARPKRNPFNGLPVKKGVKKGPTIK